MPRRKALRPDGYAERHCLLIQYWLPGLPHCYVLCHETARAPACATERADIFGFFLSQAQHLANEAVGDSEAFLLVYGGASVRKRAGLHAHLFIVQSRWQKALAYSVLATRNILLAAWLCIRPGTSSPTKAPIPLSRE